MAFDGRKNIVEIDEETKTVVFDTWKPKKITGSRLGPVLGLSEFTSEFKIACEIAGLYPGDKPNKYIEAGNVLEPVLRNYLRANTRSILGGPLNVPIGSSIAVEDPIPKEECCYDHFRTNPLFGGMVDGYIQTDAKRTHVLEIKTSNGKEHWLDDEGNITKVPDSYILQASLYAELARLDKIVFFVGFLDEADYDCPQRWKPTPENTVAISVDKPDMTENLAKAEAWYKEYIKNGITPEWTDRDAEVVKYLYKGYVPL